MTPSHKSQAATANTLSRIDAIRRQHEQRSMYAAQEGQAIREWNLERFIALCDFHGCHGLAHHLRQRFLPADKRSEAS